MRNVDALVTDAGNSLRPLLLEAFEAGRAEGRQQALKALKSKITSIWEEEAISNGVGAVALTRTLRGAHSDDDQRESGETTTPLREAKSALGG